jgi:hypothetical protein
MSTSLVWVRDGASLCCSVEVHPGQEEVLRDYVAHRLRRLRAHSLGLVHAEEANLRKDGLELRFRSANQLTPGPRRLPAAARSLRGWYRLILLPALQMLIDCHEQEIAGFAPFLPIAGRWVPPVSWFLARRPGTLSSDEVRCDLRHALAWIQRERAETSHGEEGHEASVLHRICNLCDKGDPTALSALIRAEQQQIERETEYEAHSFLMQLTEAELLERVTRVFRYRRIPPKEARRSGIEPGGDVLLEVDASWVDPDFPKLKPLSPQEIWDTLLEESRSTPVLAASVVLPNPLARHELLDETLRWIGVHEDQPLLFVRCDGVMLPDRGFLRICQPGDDVLMERKRIFTSFAGRHPALAEELSAPAPVLPFSENPQARAELEEIILATRGLFAVQGPPGTGKTYLATQVVRRFLSRTPTGRVLVCAKEHFALDNILRSITRGLAQDRTPFRAFRSVSLAKRRRGRGEIDETYLGEKVARDLAERRFIPEAAGWSQVQAATRAEHDRRLHSLAEQSADLYFCTTLDSAVAAFVDREAFDLVIIEEAGKCYPSELLHTLCLGRIVLMIGDQRQLPPYQEKLTRQGVDSWNETIVRAQRDLNYREALIERFGDTFRALLALATEQGPLGDSQRAWLRPFEYLFERLPQRHRLEEQFRMEAPLSRLIGTVFYGRPFEHRKYELVQQGRLPEDPLQGVLPAPLDVPLLWIDTPHMSKVPAAAEDPRKRGARENPFELEIVLAYLRSLRPVRPPRIDMVILTPYNAQKRLLLESQDLKQICAALTDIPFELVVRTTDEYQGREAELTVLSLVRNNSLGVRAWGFMTELERLNVMFSRTRFRQVVVGCSEHIERHAAEAPWLHKVWRQYQSESSADARCARILPCAELAAHG